MIKESGFSSEPTSRVDKLFSEKSPKIELTREEREKHHLLAAGIFNEQDIEVSDAKRELASAEEQDAQIFIENYVKDFIDNENKILAKQGRRTIGDWPQLHCDYVQEKEGGFRLAIEEGVANYAKIIALGREEGIGAAYQHYSKQAQAAGKLSFERFKQLFQPVYLSVDGLVFTADNYILIAKRHPDKVGTYGEAWHVPSGYVDETDRDGSGKISPFMAMRRELKEETGIGENHIKNLVCLGAAKNPEVAGVDVLFIGLTDLKSTDIVDRNATDVKERLLLRPEDIEGDIRPRKILGPQNESTHILPALLKINQIFGKTKKHGPPGPELAIPTSQALFFLADKLLKQK